MELYYQFIQSEKLSNLITFFMIVIGGYLCHLEIKKKLLAHRDRKAVLSKAKEGDA